MDLAWRSGLYAVGMNLSEIGIPNSSQQRDCCTGNNSVASNGISPVSLRRYILRSTSLDVANSVVCHSPLGLALVA